MYLFLAILVIFLVLIIIYLNTPKFGKIPSGKRLERIKTLPTYKNGQFQNLSETPQLTSDKSFLASLYEFLFAKKENLTPKEKVPAENTDLYNIPENTMVWLGHSTYFMNVEGKKILIDPVFHEAAPFSFMVKPFEAEYNYSPSDIPDFDLLIITHDHWDHLDYKAIKKLKVKTKHILTPIGVGEHFEHWGFQSERITELYWGEKTTIMNFDFTCLPTRHFSGRGLQRMKTLWGSFMLQTGKQTIYIGGDSGYDSHFKDIGERFTDIDLAIIENGQYNNDWKYIHLLPENLHRAMKDLNAKRYFTGHHSKYPLSYHPWTEPMENIKRIKAETPLLDIIIPKIGAIVRL